MRLTISAIALLFFCGQVQAQTTLLFEDFEDATIAYTTSKPDNLSGIADPDPDYYGRIAPDTALLPASVVFTNQQGNGIFGVDDQNYDGSAPLLILDWTGINTAGFAALELSLYVAEDDDSAAVPERWDAADQFQVFVQLDGGGYNPVFAVEAELTGSNQRPREDTNFDGVGDGAEITDVFQQFTKAIGTANLVDIRVVFTNLTADGEDIAFDNLLLVGVPEPSSFAFLLLFGSTVGFRRRRRT